MSKRKSSKLNAHSSPKNGTVSLSPITEASSFESNDSNKNINHNDAPPVFSNVIDDILDVDNNNKNNNGCKPTMNNDASYDHEDSLDEIFSGIMNNNNGNSNLSPDNDNEKTHKHYHGLLMMLPMIVMIKKNIGYYTISTCKQKKEQNVKINQQHQRHLHHQNNQLMKKNVAR